MPMRFGSAVPSATRYFTPQVMSSCILRAPLAVAGVEELLAVAGGAAEVRHQHGVAAIGEELRQGVVAPDIARPRTAVRDHQRRQALGRERPWAVSGTPESRGRPTTCSAPPSSRPAIRAASFSRTRYCSVELLGLAVEQVGFARLGVAVGGHQPELFILRARADGRLPCRATCLAATCSRLSSVLSLK